LSRILKNLKIKKIVLKGKEKGKEKDLKIEYNKNILFLSFFNMYKNK
jgi:hypothetical protein